MPAAVIHGPEQLKLHPVPLERVAEGLELCRSRPGEVLKVMVDL